MKNLKNILFPLIMLIGAQGVMAMKLPPQPPIAQPLIPMPGLPADIQRSLFPLIIQGKADEVADVILTLAHVDKAFNAAMNNEETMLAMLTMFPDITSKIVLIKRLQAKPGILPVMRSPAVRTVIANLEDTVEYGNYIRDQNRIANEKRQFIERFAINTVAATMWAMVAGVMFKGDQIAAALRK